MGIVGGLGGKLFLLLCLLLAAKRSLLRKKMAAENATKQDIISISMALVLLLDGRVYLYQLCWFLIACDKDKRM